MVEIAKALSLDARVIIMDEPTSSLTLSETDRLLEVIADLKAARRRVDLHLPPARRGRRPAPTASWCCATGARWASWRGTSISHAAMIRLMIGRDLKSLLYRRRNGRRRAGGCDIVGLVTIGLSRPAGRSLACGMARSWAWRAWSAPAAPSLPARSSASTRRSAATIRLDGAPVAIASPRDAIAQGIYLVPEDRKRAGLVLELPIAENISLAEPAGSMRGCGLVERRGGAQGREGAASGASTSRRRRVDIEAVTLSGGNQQKVVLGKWLSHAAARDDLRRADPRHRRRRQERDLRAHARARRRRASRS